MSYIKDHMMNNLQPVLFHQIESMLDQQKLQSDIDKRRNILRALHEQYKSDRNYFKQFCIFAKTQDDKFGLYEEKKNTYIQKIFQLKIKIKQESQMQSFQKFKLKRSHYVLESIKKIKQNMV